jgi:hypothetical protein
VLTTRGRAESSAASLEVIGLDPMTLRPVGLIRRLGRPSQTTLALLRAVTSYRAEAQSDQGISTSHVGRALSDT